MNSRGVIDKLKNIRDKNNVEVNILLKNYVFDRFVVRLSKSKYKDNFILKGGYYLSTLFGIENRSTMDIDASIKNTNFSEYNILLMIKEIINIDAMDNVKFTYQDVGTIRDDDEYGGYRITLLFELDSIRETLKIDVATGDPITPKEIKYKFKPILSEEYISVWTYNIETVLAEKLEAIFSKLGKSSRMKDYYDIYLIYNKDFDRVNKEHLRKAVKNTFARRNFNPIFWEDMKILKDNEILQIRWHAYRKENKYAKDIEYNEVIRCLEGIIMYLDEKVLLETF